MRVLMLAHRLPFPPITGDKVRAYHIARHLAGHHGLTLACLADEPGSAEAIAPLRQQIGDLECARIPRSPKRFWAMGRLLAGDSATRAYFDSHRLHTRIRARLSRERFDVIYVSSSSMAQYAPSVPEAPVVLDFVDVDSDKWLQYGARLPRYRGWVYQLEGSRLRRLEQEAAWRAAHCLVATRLEAELLRSFAPWTPITVIPNGVDLTYFSPPSAAPTSPTIVFTGAMDYFPNVDAVTHFAERVFPRVRTRLQEARFVIVGRNPTRAVRQLALLPGVQVTGTVPDVRPFLHQATVAVAPLRLGRGIQNKVLEAMATALPVVATSRAAQGLEARPGDHFLVEDDPDRFADAVTALIRAPARRQELGRSARAFVERHHSWPASLARLDRVLASLPVAVPAPLEAR